MPYDEAIADRIRTTLKRTKGVGEKKMFGGLAFMLNGHMACGVLKTTLVLRLGNEGAANALKESHTRPMDFTGKPLKSMVYIDPKGFNSEAALKAWVKRAVDYARSLAPK